MPTAIHQRVRLANDGKLPNAIIRLTSGWVVMAEAQVLDGYCLLFSDPVVKDLNSLDEKGRIAYSLDVIRVGDALLKLKGAARINYETWGNLDQALHTHIVPRYQNEPAGKGQKPAVVAYDSSLARKFDAESDRDFILQMRAELTRFARN